MTEHMQTYPAKNFLDSCTHGWLGQDVEILKEAEQVCVLKITDHFGMRTVIHVSVTFENWYQCRFLKPEIYEKMTEPMLMALVSQELTNLKQLTHRPQ
jgi:hypothetical protein